MTLYGADQDKDNLVNWLTNDKKFPGAKLFVSDKSLHADIKARMANLVMLDPAAIILYNITGDELAPEHEKRLAPEEFIEMLSSFNRSTSVIVITDFCHSGNFFRLRYVLEVNPEGHCIGWKETEEWSHGSRAGPEWSHPITSPMLHLAGSAERENVYETERTGGYFTDVLTKTEPMPLPELLVALRTGVNRHLAKAKRHEKRPIASDATQTPQVYSSLKLPLDDPGVLTKIYAQEILSYL
ncbi:hypothetical protein OPQ81_003750 [Rhizoctonia solani]|nr:hypothetical protein OPQ81_003750 [Rhizoctonia solani]